MAVALGWAVAVAAVGAIVSLFSGEQRACGRSVGDLAAFPAGCRRLPPLPPADHLPTTLCRCRQPELCAGRLRAGSPPDQRRCVRPLGAGRAATPAGALPAWPARRRQKHVPPAGCAGAVQQKGAPRAALPRAGLRRVQGASERACGVWVGATADAEMQQRLPGYLFRA